MHLVGFTIEVHLHSNNMNLCWSHCQSFISLEYDRREELKVHMTVRFPSRFFMIFYHVRDDSVGHTKEICT